MDATVAATYNQVLKRAQDGYHRVVRLGRREEIYKINLTQPIRSLWWSLDIALSTSTLNKQRQELLDGKLTSNPGLTTSRKHGSKEDTTVIEHYVVLCGIFLMQKL